MHDLESSGVEMSWGLFCPWFKLRGLMVALAAIGLGLDTIPTPVLAAAGFSEPVGMGTNSADSEEERDAADDPNDPAVTLVQTGTWGEKRPLHAPGAGLPRASTLRSGRPIHDPAASNLPRIPLAIWLCRFTC